MTKGGFTEDQGVIIRRKIVKYAAGSLIVILYLTVIILLYIGNLSLTAGLKDQPAMIMYYIPVSIMSITLAYVICAVIRVCRILRGKKNLKTNEYYTALLIGGGILYTIIVVVIIALF